MKHKFILLPLLTLMLSACQLPDLPFFPNPNQGTSNNTSILTNTLPPSTPPYFDTATPPHHENATIYVGSENQPVDANTLVYQAQQLELNQRMDFYVKGIVSTSFIGNDKVYRKIKVCNNDGSIYDYISFGSLDLSEFNGDMELLNQHNFAVGYEGLFHGVYTRKNLSNTAFYTTRTKLLELHIPPAYKQFIPTEICTFDEIDLYPDGTDYMTLNYFTKPCGVLKEKMTFEVSNPGLELFEYDMVKCNPSFSFSPIEHIKISYGDIVKVVNVNIKKPHPDTNQIIYIDFYYESLGKNRETFTYTGDGFSFNTKEDDLSIPSYYDYDAVRFTSNSSWHLYLEPGYKLVNMRWYIYDKYDVAFNLSSPNLSLDKQKLYVYFDPISNQESYRIDLTGEYKLTVKNIRLELERI